MLFHSLEFLIFFAVFCAALYVRPLRRTTVLVASNVFYGWWDWRLLSLIWFTVSLDFWIARWMTRSPSATRRRWLLALSVGTNLVVLGFFKYLPAAATGIYGLAGRPAPAWVADWILPLGISFYTFQSIAYTVDVYRRRYPPLPTLVDFANFVFFFPQLVAGPIERPDHLSPQLERITPPIWSRLPRAAFMFSYGMLRKTAADAIASLIDPQLASLTTLDRGSLILCVLGFGFQIYLDFSAYTWMARGLAWLVNIELMENFREPYLATSPSDFWRRWHISLSTWLRDYLYIPLGGNKVGTLRVYLNLMVVMLLGGLWHGAALGFIIWGFLHGLLLIAFRRAAQVEGGGTVLGKIAGWAITFAVAGYAWLFFRLPNPSQYIAAHDAFLVPGFRFADEGAYLVLAWIGFSFAVDLMRRWTTRIQRLPFDFAYGLGTVLCISLAIAFRTPDIRPYVYFIF